MEKIKKIKSQIDYLNNKSAEEYFNMRYKSIIEKIKELKILVNNLKGEFQNDKKNYGFSGSLGYVEDQLIEAVNFLKNEE